MRPALSWTLPSTWENWENWGSTSQPTILPGKNGTKMYKTLYKLEKNNECKSDFVRIKWAMASIAMLNMVK
jgi:hypothetical protein